jgi:subtilisin family serine protease
LGGTTYGVEYDKATIDRQLADYKAGGAPYATIRHQPDPDPNKDEGRHGTHVAGVAVGNGRGDARYTAAAPRAHLIFVSVLKFRTL